MAAKDGGEESSAEEDSSGGDDDDEDGGDAKVIALSQVSADVRAIARSVARAFGAAIADDFSDSVTHLIVPSADFQRTMKLMLAILNGAAPLGSFDAAGTHIVTDAWLMQSVEAGRFVDEGPFISRAFPGIALAATATEGGGIEPFLKGELVHAMTARELLGDIQKLVSAAGGKVEGWP
jgi:pyridoxal biosynthesis lyase PdxS